jgi:phospholipid transport system substrate-binding protein
VAVALLFPLLISPGPLWAAESGARAVVERTVSEVLEILAQKDWSTEARVSKIEEIAYQRFDFGTISRLVLARNYKKFSQAQRGEFEQEFKAYLSRSYGSRVDRYEQEKVEIAGERLEARGDVTVRTRIVGGQADGIEIHYRLREREGTWRVIDVVIEGVSLVSSYRSQFQELMGRGGPEHLLERLRAKNLDEEGVVPIPVSGKVSGY